MYRSTSQIQLTMKARVNFFLFHCYCLTVIVAKKMSVRFDTKQFSTADRKDKAPSTQCRRSLKMQLYSGCGWAYRPHWSVTKTKLFENALQPERIWNAGFAFWHDANRKHFNKLTHFLKTMTMIPLPKLSSNTLLRKTRNEGKIRWMWLSWSVKRNNVFHHFYR